MNDLQEQMEVLSPAHIIYTPEQVKDWIQNLNDPDSDKLIKTVKFREAEDRSRLDTIASAIVMRTTKKKGYDMILANTGYEGTGKSLLSIILAKKISSRNGKQFTIADNIIYKPTYAQMIHVLRTVEEGSVVIVDEAITIMYNRNWNDAEQKEMNTVFSLIRERNLIVILNIPRFSDLDSYFKNGRVLLWMSVFGRFKGVLFAHDPNQLNTDTFNLKYAAKVLAERGKEIFDVDNLILTLMDAIPNFITWFNIPLLSEAEIAEYKALKKKYTIEIPLEEKSQKKINEELTNRAIADLFESSPEWTYKKLGERYSLSEYKIKQIIKAEKERREEAQAKEEARLKEVGEQDGIKYT